MNGLIFLAYTDSTGLLNYDISSSHGVAHCSHLWSLINKVKPSCHSMFWQFCRQHFHRKVINDCMWRYIVAPHPDYHTFCFNYICTYIDQWDLSQCPTIAVNCGSDNNGTRQSHRGHTTCSAKPVTLFAGLRVCVKESASPTRSDNQTITYFGDNEAQHPIIASIPAAIVESKRPHISYKWNCEMLPQNEAEGFYCIWENAKCPPTNYVHMLSIRPDWGTVLVLSVFIIT